MPEIIPLYPCTAFKRTITRTVAPRTPLRYASTMRNNGPEVRPPPLPPHDPKIAHVCNDCREGEAAEFEPAAARDIYPYPRFSQTK